MSPYNPGDYVESRWNTNMNNKHHRQETGHIVVHHVIEEHGYHGQYAFGIRREIQLSLLDMGNLPFIYS